MNESFFLPHTTCVNVCECVSPAFVIDYAESDMWQLQLQLQRQSACRKGRAKSF